LEGREDGALEGICSKLKDLVREECKLSKKRPGSPPGAALKSKMPRTDDDGEGPGISSGKRGWITLGDAGEDSSSNAKKLKQDSTSASTSGGFGGAVAASVSDSDCNELVRFLKFKGLGSIAPQLSEALGVENIENLQELMKEDLEDPCCAFLKPMQKRILLKLAAESIAHAQSLRDDQLSSAETGSQGSVATSEAESSDESGDEQSSSFDAVSAKHLGNPADFQEHISGFIRGFRDYISDSAPETATELFHFNSHELSYCMLVWMRFAKEAVLEELMRRKWNDCIKAARQDSLLSMLETCLQQEGTKHKCWARDDFKRLQVHCRRKSCAAAIFVTDMMISDSLRAHPASVKEWQQDVVKNWFKNSEEAPAFLFRANVFLRQHVINGISVVNQVVETKSYVAFMRMTHLSSLLLFEYLHTRKLQDASAPRAAGSTESSLFNGFQLFMSSSNGVFSLTEADAPARRALPTVLRGLRCLSRLSPTAWQMMGGVQTVNDICHAQSALESEEMDLERGKGKATVWHEVRAGDNETSAQASSATTRPRTSLPSQSESKRVSGPASRQAQSQRVSGPASRHEPRTRVPTNPQLRVDESADETLNAAIRTLERGRDEVYTKRAMEIFHHDSANCACIRRYLQQLVQQDTSQKDRLSVGSYVDSASGEVRLVDGGSVALELMASRSFLDECNKSAKTVMEDLRCPISGGLLQDPVTCSDGHTYERAFIVHEFRQAEIAFEEQKKSVDPRTIFEFKSPIEKQPLEFKLEKGLDRRELKFNGEIREELRVKNEEICDKIKQFKESKLAELNNMKLNVEGEEEKNILRSRFGYASQAGSSSETQGEVFETAKTFFNWIVARSRAGLACLTGPPASGKTVTMQQIVHAAVQDCGAQMDIDGSMPLLPLFMRAAVVSKLMSKCDRWTLSGTDCKPDQLLGEVISEFLDHAIKEGIFEEELKSVILELYEYGRVFICIDGLDEAAAHQELLEVCIEHAVKSAQQQSQRRLHVLLSTREHSYIHSRACLRLGDFDVVHLQELNKARQKKMIEGRIVSDKVDSFCQQLAAIASKHQELTTSPFMLSLMIEVYHIEGKIPTQRVELYEKQVTALVSRCIDGRLRDGDVGTGGLRDKKREVASLFLETLAFVCQMRLATRDFKLEDCASHMSELWQDTEEALSEAAQLLFTSPTVGLLAAVGGNSYRFNHLTLQEYLAAKCSLRLFEQAGARTLLEHLRQDESLFSRWRREVLQFNACMMREETFPEFCQVLLEIDDATGACCELVQDFLKERGPSEAVERMLRDQMQKIRGTDLLLAGLCHPCPEMRSLVLSEMSQFRVPPNPFADETVPKLKGIAEDTNFAWHKRAAAMLSLAQIAQMKHCSRSDRAETIGWSLKMLQSESVVLENVQFALVKALGTMLEEGGESAAGSGIMLQPEDESLLLQPGLRESVAVANALSDLKIYSAGLVDWLEREPSLIAQGQWPIRHVRFLCENVAASKNSQMASHLINSLLLRLHSSSFQMSDREFLFQGLDAATFRSRAATNYLVATRVLPFLESGDAEQRARVLKAAVDTNVRFEGEDATSRLARCLLLEVGPTSAHESSRTSLLAYVLKREAETYGYSSLRERSGVFVFLVNIMAQSTGDSQQVVSRYLKDFEKVHVEENPKQGKQEPGSPAPTLAYGEDDEKMDEDGLFSADAENELDSERDRATPALHTNPSYALSCSLSHERTSHAQEQNSTADRVIIHPSLRRLKIEAAELSNDSDNSGVSAKPMGEDASASADKPVLLTRNIPLIDWHLKDFLPGILDQKAGSTKTDVCERYCAASLWTSSGLLQETGAEKIDIWMLLQGDEPAHVAKALKDLQHLKNPWMTGCEGTDGEWERQVFEALQQEVLGRFIFAILLSYIREKVMREPSSALEGFSLLSKKIRQWDAKTDEKRLEQQFLLKELCIGRRNEHLPSWSGGVTQMNLGKIVAQDLSLQCKLKFDDGSTEFMRRASYSIGRDPSNNRTTDEPTVSRKHCTLTLSKEFSCVMLEDTSTNGTFVNGNSVKCRCKALTWGDKVEVVRSNQVCLIFVAQGKCSLDREMVSALYACEFYGASLSLSDLPVFAESVLHCARNGTSQPSDPGR
jgi:hypothetical protein